MILFTKITVNLAQKSKFSKAKQLFQQIGAPRKWETDNPPMFFATYGWKIVAFFFQTALNNFLENVEGY